VTGEEHEGSWPQKMVDTWGKVQSKTLKVKWDKKNLLVTRML